jgi:hypothetical protein
MTDRQLLANIIDAGTRMRTCQKDFFNKSRLQPLPTNAELIIAAKKAEKEFDILLINVKEMIK